MKTYEKPRQAHKHKIAQYQRFICIQNIDSVPAESVLKYCSIRRTVILAVIFRMNNERTIAAHYCSMHYFAGVFAFCVPQNRFGEHFVVQLCWKLIDSMDFESLFNEEVMQLNVFRGKFNPRNTIFYRSVWSLLNILLL